MPHASVSLKSNGKTDKAARPGSNLQLRKQQFIRDEIWDAAIGLFAEKGFDETTVEDIAKTAGVSRRSFFRYFSSKNDLMAQGMLSYGQALTGAIDGCPRSYSLLEVLRHTVMQVAQQSAAHSRTRAIIEISAKYPAARDAQRSRLGDVQEQVAQAYARRSKPSRKGDLTPKILAGLTLILIDVSLGSWFERGHSDISPAVRQAFNSLGKIVCDDGSRSL